MRPNTAAARADHMRPARLVLAPHRAVPGLALCALGVAMLILALGLPAWRGADVGPGLMAQLLALGVIALGAVWAVLHSLQRGNLPPAGGCVARADSHDAQPASGPALLGAVLAFAVALPMAGLVAAAGLAAGLAAWGAGERHARAIAATALGLAGLTAGIGVLLLPPTAPLWPRF